MVSLTHTTQASGANNPNKQLSVNVWNEEHRLTGTANRLIAFDQSGNPIEVPFVTPEMFGANGSGDEGAELQAAIDAAESLGCPVRLMNSYSFGTTLELGSGAQIVGTGSQSSILTYTGEGKGIVSKTPGTRAYGWGLSGFQLVGATGTTGIELDSVSSCCFADVVVKSFAVQFDIYSPTSGYSVYNRFNACMAQGGTGYRLRGTSSNANAFIACRANLCTARSVDITDGNDNYFTGCQFESGGTGVGVYITATVSGLAPGNTFHSCRMEGFSGGTGYHVASSNVTDTRIILPLFLGTVTAPVTDSGTRTQVLFPNGSTTPSKQTSALAATTGSPWTFERTTNGGTEIPAYIIRDSNAGSGTPVTLQVETERNAGYSIRVRRAATDQFTVTPAGVVDAASQYKVGGTKVLGAQGAAVADATDAASAITQLNVLLARLRAHGMIAS